MPFSVSMTVWKQFWADKGSGKSTLKDESGKQAISARGNVHELCMKARMHRTDFCSLEGSLAVFPMGYYSESQES